MPKLKLYKIKTDYIKYLHKIDSRVQFHPERPDAYTQNRPYVGIVLSVNDKQYFAPLEHPRPQHQTLKNNLHIIKINGGRHGLIGLNNMIPVPLSQLIDFDISKDNNKDILTAQFIFCQKNFKLILSRAEDVYKSRLKPNDFVKRVFCDFQKLEAAAERYEAFDSSEIT